MDDQTQPQQPQQPQQPFPPAAPTPAPAQPDQPASPYAQPTPPPAPMPAPAPAPYGQPQQPGQQPMPQPAGYYQPVAPQSSGKAIGALVCGILAILFSGSVLFGIVLGIVAIVLAVQAAKQTGKDGKTTGAKVCGIAGIVLSVLAFFLYVVFGLGMLAYVAAYDDYSNDYSYRSSSSASDLPTITDGDSQMQAVVADKLDLLKNKDSATVQSVVEKADEQLSDAIGYSLTDVGIDPAAFVEWMLVDFDYELDGVYDNGDGTGTAYADVTVHDSTIFATTFMEDVQAAIDAGDVKTLDEAGAKALVGELFQAAMDKTTETTTDYISLDLVKTGDSWTVDEDSWSDELDYLFGL